MEHHFPNAYLSTSIMQNFSKSYRMMHYISLLAVNEKLDADYLPILTYWKMVSTCLNTVSLIYVPPDLSLNCVTSQYMDRSKPPMFYFVSVLVISWNFCGHM